MAKRRAAVEVWHSRGPPQGSPSQACTRLERIALGSGHWRAASAGAVRRRAGAVRTRAGASGHRRGGAGDEHDGEQARAPVEKMSRARCVLWRASDRFSCERRIRFPRPRRRACARISGARRRAVSTARRPLGTCLKIDEPLARLPALDGPPLNALSRISGAPVSRSPKATRTRAHAGLEQQALGAPYRRPERPARCSAERRMASPGPCPGWPRAGEGMLAAGTALSATVAPAN